MPIALLWKILPWLLILGEVGSGFGDRPRKKRRKSRRVTDDYEYFD